MLEVARLFWEAKPARTLRLAAFVNEEPPFFRTNQMKSRAHSQRSKQRGVSLCDMGVAPRATAGATAGLEGR